MNQTEHLSAALGGLGVTDGERFRSWAALLAEAEVDHERRERLGAARGHLGPTESDA